MSSTPQSPSPALPAGAPPGLGRPAAAAFGAYVIWGLFPLYFSALAAVPSLEVLADRILGSLVVLIFIAAGHRHRAEIRAVIARPRVLGLLCLSAVAIAANWGVYIYAVQTGRAVDASLGYYVNPLVSVVLGVVFLRERPRAMQILAFFLAIGGVAWIAGEGGGLPWIAIALAMSFGTYGLLRKLAAVGAVAGLAIETAVLAPVALGWTIFAAAGGALAIPSAGPLQVLLLLAAGAVTVVPLLMFGFAAPRLPLGLLGFLQYVNPTCQLAVAVFLLGETVSEAQGVAFVLIWIALALYTGDAVVARRRSLR
ncbi:MAG: protein RarD [Tistrella sp.]|uniref:EamA family transporter RarD n=1 Tax=Tistrella mobilis TaxID=171437 RepID=A0A3B9IU92_9PROT|nr:EamA family transporter RarD [Tistrella sp.]MAD39257.1 protein RarD [Tistrella sp.]MBA76273.1 protein RarD [Tistrella sp.]HAE51384.1 EamA family transporter RarD [Tistrella mobilis]